MTSGNNTVYMWFQVQIVIVTRSIFALISSSPLFKRYNYGQNNRIPRQPSFAVSTMNGCESNLFSLFVVVSNKTEWLVGKEKTHSSDPTPGQ